MMMQADERLPVDRQVVRGIIGKIVEPMIEQQLIQAPIEGMARRCRQIGHWDPHLHLSIACAFAHRHERSVVQEA